MTYHGGIVGGSSAGDDCCAEAPEGYTLNASSERAHAATTSAPCLDGRSLRDSLGSAGDGLARLHPPMTPPPQGPRAAGSDPWSRLAASRRLSGAALAVALTGCYELKVY